jgi:hypothetical protein
MRRSPGKLGADRGVPQRTAIHTLILSMHIADDGPRASLAILRSRPRPARTPGLRYAETMLGAELSSAVLPRANPRRAGLLAAWDDDAALDRFLAEDPLARRLAGGWRVRLQPLRVSGAWTGLPELPKDELPVDPEEPVAVLTLGRLRLNHVVRFLRANAPAAGQAVADPALLAGTAFARPPGLVATFSLWRSASAMRAYAYGRSGNGHLAAIGAQRARSFHHESAFIRLRPHGAEGSWDGREPLAELASTPGA